MARQHPMLRFNAVVYIIGEGIDRWSGLQQNDGRQNAAYSRCAGQQGIFHPLQQLFLQTLLPVDRFVRSA